MRDGSGWGQPSRAPGLGTRDGRLIAVPGGRQCRWRWILWRPRSIGVLTTEPGVQEANAGPGARQGGQKAHTRHRGDRGTSEFVLLAVLPATGVRDQRESKQVVVGEGEDLGWEVSHGAYPLSCEDAAAPTTSIGCGGGRDAPSPIIVAVSVFTPQTPRRSSGLARRIRRRCAVVSEDGHCCRRQECARRYGG